MLPQINDFVATPEQLIGMTALLVVAFLIASLGALIAGKSRRAESDLIFGWAVISASFTALGTSNLVSFFIVAIGLALLAIGAAILLWRRREHIGPQGAWKAAVLVLPMIFVATAMIPSQWDDLTHWLPNARFLIEFDSFPNPSLPNPSHFSAYPYGVALITYLASQLAGHMVANATSLFNILLIVSYGLLVTRISVTIAQTDSYASETGPTPIQLNNTQLGWAFCALAILVATGLNPTYVTRLVLSSYADLPTTVTIGFTSIFIWLMLNSLSSDNIKLAHSYAWQASLCATAAIALKQVNLVLFLSLLIAITVITLRDKSISIREVLKLCHKFILLPLTIYVVWRIYVSYSIPNAEHAFRPFEDWIFTQTDQILSRMALIASKKGGYFGVMTLATFISLRVFWHPRTAFDRLVIITGIMFLCYNGFLFCSYLGAFSEGEALRAASYWRYNTHLGGVCLVFAACVIAHVWQRYQRFKIPKGLNILIVILVLITPLALAKKFRFDLDPRITYARTITTHIKALLTSNDRLILADLDSDGRYITVMRYGLYGSATIVNEMTAGHKPYFKNLNTTITQQNASHIWIYSAHPEIDRIFDVPIEANKSYLLSKEKNAWQVKGSWPHLPQAKNEN